MKKAFLGAFLIAALSMANPLVSQANSLSRIPTAEETGIPTEIYQQAEIIGSELNICPELLLAIAERESNFKADAVNGPCKGLMQLNVSVHEQRFADMEWSAADWSSPYKNMYVAAGYLSELFEKYEDVGVVLGVYHGETEAVARGEAGKLSQYAKRILERSEELERMAGK